MANIDLMTTVGTTTLADSLSWGKIGRRLVLGGGLILIPFIPELISRIADIPNRIMDHGYELHWIKEPHRREVRFGKNVFSENRSDLITVSTEEADDHDC